MKNLRAKIQQSFPIRNYDNSVVLSIQIEDACSGTRIASIELSQTSIAELMAGRLTICDVSLSVDPEPLSTLGLVRHVKQRVIDISHLYRGHDNYRFQRTHEWTEAVYDASVAAEPDPNWTPRRVNGRHLFQGQYDVNAKTIKVTYDSYSEPTWPREGRYSYQAVDDFNLRFPVESSLFRTDEGHEGHPVFIKGYAYDENEPKVMTSQGIVLLSHLTTTEPV